MTETPAKYGAITLKKLKIYYAENGYHLNDSAFEENLKLRTASGKYNVLAELLSDHNMVPIIVVRFQGKDKSALSERNDYGDKYLLFSYEQIKNTGSLPKISVFQTRRYVRESIELYLTLTASTRL